MSWFFLGLHLGESHCGLLVDAQLIPAFQNSSSLSISPAILSLLFILFSNLYHLHQTDFACYRDGGVDATSTWVGIRGSHICSTSGCSRREISFRFRLSPSPNWVWILSMLSWKFGAEDTGVDRLIKSYRLSFPLFTLWPTMKGLRYG